MCFATNCNDKKKKKFGMDMSEKENIVYYMQNKEEWAQAFLWKDMTSVPNPVVQIVLRQIANHCSVSQKGNT